MSKRVCVLICVVLAGFMAVLVALGTLFWIGHQVGDVSVQGIARVTGLNVSGGDITNVEDITFSGTLYAIGEWELEVSSGSLVKMKEAGSGTEIHLDPSTATISGSNGALIVHIGSDSGDDFTIGDSLFVVEGDTSKVTAAGNVEIDLASGDPSIVFDTQGADKYTLGIDDSDSDTLKLAAGGSIGDYGLIHFGSYGFNELYNRDGYGGPALDMYSYSDGASSYPYIAMYSSYTDTLGSDVETPDDQVLGMIEFYGTEQEPLLEWGAYIEAKQDGVAGALYVPAELKLAAVDEDGNEATLTIDGPGNGVSVGQFLNLGPQTEISVTNGSVFTPTGSYQWIAAASEVTPTISTSGFEAGDLLELENREASIINFEDTGNQVLAGNCALGLYDVLVVRFDGTRWIARACSNN